jgi:hypothetical protein
MAVLPESCSGTSGFIEEDKMIKFDRIEVFEVHE